MASSSDNTDPIELTHFKKVSSMANICPSKDETPGVGGVREDDYFPPSEVEGSGGEEESDEQLVFRSGTLTRRSRRTCRELRVRKNQEEENSSVCQTESAILDTKESVISRTETRRHSLHSPCANGYVTLPRMTGLVGMTLSDLKTKRKGDSHPTAVSALLDLRFFKQDLMINPSAKFARYRERIDPMQPVQSSYSCRLKNSINRRRRSIPAIETIFKSIRSLSSPGPSERLEELNEPKVGETDRVDEKYDRVKPKVEESDKTDHVDENGEQVKPKVVNPHKVLMKQASSISLPAPVIDSITTSPPVLRKTSSISSEEDTTPLLDLEELIQAGQEILRLSPSAVLNLIKVW